MIVGYLSAYQTWHGCIYTQCTGMIVGYLSASPDLAWVYIHSVHWDDSRLFICITRLGMGVYTLSALG